MKVYKILMLALLTLGIFACGNTDPVERAAGNDEAAQEAVPEGTRLKTDAMFLKQYGEYTLFSMAAAEMATDRAVNPEVRALAEEISKDHTDMYKQLEQLGQENKLPVPDVLPEELSDELDELRETEAQTFDQMYLQKVIKYHKAIQDEAKNLIANSELDPIIDFARRIEAEQYLHLNRAREIAAELS